MIEEMKWKLLNIANVAWLTIATQDVVSFGLEALGVGTLIWFNVERAVAARKNRMKSNEKD
jgi:hypothetical protein